MLKTNQKKRNKKIYVFVFEVWVELCELGVSKPSAYRLFGYVFATPRGTNANDKWNIHCYN